MAATKRAGQAKDSSAPDYKVITVTELDQMVYKRLRIEGAAKPSKDEASGYVITNKEAALSQNIMPKVLNSLGKNGWRLTAVNKMECYIFTRDGNKSAVEYKVMTPGDLDRMAMENLEKTGALRLNRFEGLTPAMEIVEPEAASIQKVLPEVLVKIGEDGWQLCAVSGPQLYIFSRNK